jgi:putative oxidoreductase
MNLLHRFEHWGDTHHPRWVDIVRIGLGIFLCIKGIQFPQQMSVLLSKIPFDTLTSNAFALVVLGHYILFAHLLGGIMLIFGVFTRFACLIQLPILLGAILFINTSREWWQPFSELYISIVVFLLLVYFLIAGNGRLSFEKYIREEAERK